MRRAIVAATALCLAALAINAWWVDSQTRAAAPRDGGVIIDTPIVPANVKVEGQGPAVLLIHGFGAAIDWWDKIAPGLAANHRVIRVDLIGHGGTAAPLKGYSIERQAALVSAVLDKLGVGRVAVIGHSMGGEVAAALAAMKPERIERLVLIDTPAQAGAHFSPATDLYFQPIIGELLSHFITDRTLRRGLSQAFAPGFPVPEKFVADIKQLTYTAFRNAHDESVIYRATKPIYERLAALKPMPPLLVIFGTRDRVVPPGQALLYQKVPGAAVAMIEGAGHSPMIEKPTKFSNC